MGKGRRNRERRTREAASPVVRARVVLGDVDLAEAVNVIRPALLYADRVTVHAPAASLLLALGSLEEITDPLEQLEFVVSTSQAHPEVVGELGISSQDLASFREFLRLDRSAVRRTAGGARERRALDEMYAQVDGMSSLFADQFGEAMQQATAAVGADELVAAARSGLLSVEPLQGLGRNQAMNGVIAAVRGAGEEGEWDFGDEMVASLVEAMLTALSSTDAIPVLDEGASGLARAMRDGGLLGSRSSLGKAEIAIVAGLMGNLPHLSGAPLDQVVSLRTKLHDPLTRFRSAVSNMSAHFSSEIYDESLALEIQLAWRQEVAPALLEIREVLQEEGLLRSLRDVAMENPPGCLVRLPEGS